MAKKSANQRRIDNLTKWAKDRAFIPGMKQETYIDIFEYILSEQEPKGYWKFPEENWEVVMTAVILKALSFLAFELDDTWDLESGGPGSVRIAVAFVEDEVKKKQGDPKVGEDVWDGCQAALALAKFGMRDQAQPMVANINDNWKAHYDFALAAIKNRWCGPAYLSAMIDVLQEYAASLAHSNVVAALKYLRDLEQKDQKNNEALGFFSASAQTPRVEMDLWNTVLVLRTLCAAGPLGTDSDQIRRIAGWILDRLDSHVWTQTPGEAPMFLARSLHGLRSALPFVEDISTRLRIRNWFKEGNETIEKSFQAKRENKIDLNLKSYSAVAEYLGDWTVEAPAGLIFHASQILTSSPISNIEPEARENGLRIAWLSDLHIAQSGDSEPSSFNLLRRWAGSWMQFKDTPLSSEFQRLNVKTILRHVEELDVDHILVTGDLTNYAQQNQFESVKAEFMAMQAARGSRPGARPSGRTELDPTFWTILPGNHDVTNLKPGTGYEKANLGMFFDAFGSTYNKDFDNRNHDLAFPVAKNIPSRNGSFSVRLIGLDSNVREPVWHVGVNARGKIDSQQMGKLQRELPKENSAALTLVALHHHPIVVVELGSKLEDYFLSLKESQGRELIKLCAHMKVAAILHGHFHAFSSWSGLTPQNTHMAIIGSSAGTLVVPGTQEEFLELREADLVTQGAEQHGLALYAHQLMRDGKWGEKYTDIFLPVLAQG